MEAGRPGDSLRRPVCHRERAEHRADHVPHASLRGPRHPADLTGTHAGRHHSIPRPLHSGQMMKGSFDSSFLLLIAVV